MVYDIGLHLSFQNDARRDNAITQITTYVQQFNLYVPAQIGGYDAIYKNWRHALTAFLRFITQADRDNLWSQLDTRLGSGVNGPVTNSIGWNEDCDETNEMFIVNYTSRTW